MAVPCDVGASPTMVVVPTVTSASGLSPKPAPTTPPVAPCPAEIETARRGAGPGERSGAGGDPPPGDDPSDPGARSGGLDRPAPGGEEAAPLDRGGDGEPTASDPAPDAVGDPAAWAAAPEADATGRAVGDAAPPTPAAASP